MRSTKSQIYMTDYIVAILVFFMFIMIFYRYEPNLTRGFENSEDDLVLDAKTISISLVSQGVPNDWWKKQPGQILRIGIGNKDQSINYTKMSVFYGMNYTDQKEIFNTKNEFFIYLENSNGSREYINGSNSTGLWYGDSEKVSSVTRIINYNNNLYRLVVLSWK